MTKSLDRLNSPEALVILMFTLQFLAQLTIKHNHAPVKKQNDCLKYTLIHTSYNRLFKSSLGRSCYLAWTGQVQAEKIHVSSCCLR